MPLHRDGRESTERIRVSGFREAASYKKTMVDGRNQRRNQEKDPRYVDDWQSVRRARASVRLKAVSVRSMCPGIVLPQTTEHVDNFKGISMLGHQPLGSALVCRGAHQFLC